MAKSGINSEPLCETSEKGEKLFTREELVPVGLEIGRRILEIFGYQKISSIVFKLRLTADEINAVISGEAMPSVALLLAIHEATGASIHWMVTGKGEKYIKRAFEGTSTRPRLRSKPVVSLKHHAR